MKLDLVKDLDELYRPPSDHVIEVDVPDMMFLSIDGSGDPATSPAFQNAIHALYAMSYGAKFDLKRRRDTDHRVMPLEALWWSEGRDTLDLDHKATWSWRAMIAQPWTVTDDVIARVRDDVSSTIDETVLARVHFGTFAEGPCVQILHIGPYEAELPTIEKMRAYIDEHGLTARGRHHEIYLGDARRAAPEKLRTILRQPVW